jgi:CheY-like chemotaxis protein
MEKILVVDDDEDLLLILWHALKGNGYQVTTLSDPGLVLETIAHTQPDIIILDISMGKWDGRDICAEVKKVEAYRHIPVVLYSGMVNANAQEKCQPDLFLQKPLSTNYFLRKIKELIPA